MEIANTIISKLAFLPPVSNADGPRDLVDHSEASVFQYISISPSQMFGCELKCYLLLRTSFQWQFY